MDPYLGMIMMWPCPRIPDGWMLCQGQALQISDYEQLYSIIGNTYGTGSIGTFLLPNMVSRVPMGVGQAPGLAKYTLGQIGGAEGVVLTEDQIPAHTHDVLTIGAKMSVSATSGLLVSASAATQSVPNASTNVLAAGASDFDNGNGVIDVYNFGPATNTVSLPGTVTLTAGYSPALVKINNGNDAHSNIQPTMGMNYIICVNGVYPPHPNS